MDKDERENILTDVQRIFEEVGTKSEEEIQAYLIENGLEDVVTDEKIDEILRKAAAMIRRRSFRVVK